MGGHEITYTVQNEFGFPGRLLVGLPTLVQNPPTTNNNVNPTNLDRPLKKKKLPSPGGKLTEFEPFSKLLLTALAIELWCLVRNDANFSYRDHKSRLTEYDQVAGRQPE